MRAATIAMVFGLLLSACNKNSPQPQSNELLKDVASFPLGAAIDFTLLKTNSSYRDILTREHTSITAENAMKLPTLHAAPDKFDFTESDFIVAFALGQSKRVHGHTLLWHSFQDVSWVKNFTGDSAAWEALVKTHIQTVVGHFKGKVASWDVVNEAFRDDDGTLRKEDRNPGTDDDGSIFARKLGNDYVARAFQYARQADPDALLFYNDYGQEWNAKKLQSILDMVADFKKRSIPIDGIGIQMHTDIVSSNPGIANAVQKLADTGLKIHISELDVSVNPSNNSGFTYSDGVQAIQSSKYEFIVQTYRTAVPASQQFGITTWNVTDGDSWITTWLKRKDFPLLFDSQYSKKKTYDGFLEGLK